MQILNVVHKKKWNKTLTSHCWAWQHIILEWMYWESLSWITLKHTHNSMEIYNFGSKSIIIYYCSVQIMVQSQWILDNYAAKNVQYWGRLDRVWLALLCSNESCGLDTTFLWFQLKNGFDRIWNGLHINLKARSCYSELNIAWFYMRFISYALMVLK